MDPPFEPESVANPETRPRRAAPAVDPLTSSSARVALRLALVAGLLAAVIVSQDVRPRAKAVQRRLELITSYDQRDAAVPIGVAARAVAAVSQASTSTTTKIEPGSRHGLRVEGLGTAVGPSSSDEAQPSPGPVAQAPDAQDPATGDPAIVSRPIPAQPPAAAAAPAPTSPWSDRSRTTAAGYVATEVGCAAGLSAAALDAFFAERIGPLLGSDYQHVYPLGGSRYLWLFQDSFVDYSGAATDLAGAAFVHNSAMVQDGACFTLVHRGSIASVSSFEQGTGESRLAKWFWPMGGETFDGLVYVFWAEMAKDGYEPAPPNGLGWHPTRTWLAVYDAATLERLSFTVAPNSGVSPIYGYSVNSDAEYTYLFGNSFEQNLEREGGYFNGPHSGTEMWLARLPRGQFDAAPEYRTEDGWSFDAGAARPFAQRYWAENPMQPRYLEGQWVAVTKVDGYWGESLSVDVANFAWGPWTTVQTRKISPRNADPLMNTYNAYLMPWTDSGSMVVSVSQNARDMLRDAWPNPARYRLAFFGADLVAPPPPPDDVATTTSVAEDPAPTDPAPSTTTTTDMVPSPTATSADPVATTTTTTTTTTIPATTTTVPMTTTADSTTTIPATTTTHPDTTTTVPATTPITGPT